MLLTVVEFTSNKKLVKENLNKMSEFVSVIYGDLKKTDKNAIKNSTRLAEAKTNPEYIVNAIQTNILEGVDIELAELERLNAKRRHLELQLAATESSLIDFDAQLKEGAKDNVKRIKLDSMIPTKDEVASHQSLKPQVPFNFVFKKLNENNIFDSSADDIKVVTEPSRVKVSSPTVTLSSTEWKDLEAQDIIESIDNVHSHTNKDHTNEDHTNKDHDDDDDDDDDDVIEIRTEPVTIDITDDDVKTDAVIVEITDDDVDQHQVKTCSSFVSSSDVKNDTASSRGKVLSPSFVTSSINEFVDGHWVNYSTIDVQKLLENAAKIKVEPRDSDDEDYDDCFLDIGEIFPIDAPEAPDNRSQGTTTPHQQHQRTISPVEVTDIEGNTNIAPVERKIYSQFKINSKNITRVNTKHPEPEIRIIPRKIVRPKADETSGLCTIM